MIINKISIKKLNLKLAKQFAYFTATLKYLPYILVKIKTDEKIIGYGEAAVAWDVTGENQEGAIGMKKYLVDILYDQPLNNLDDITKLMSQINLYIAQNSALKCAIESAFFDVLGKFLKKPVYEILGLKNKTNVISQLVISYSDDKSSLNIRIKNFITHGGKIVKIKVGQSFNDEILLIKNIISSFPDIKIVLDVNQGWTDFSLAWIKIKKLQSMASNILWIEQPVKAQDLESLSKLSQKSVIPIMVDESCHNLADLKSIHKVKAAKYINIKLAKTGGILEAQKMVDFCDKHGLKYMLGDMVQSQIGTAYNLQAANLGDFVSFDLTTPEQIIDDSATGLENFENNFSIPNGFGLGIQVNETK